MARNRFTSTDAAVADAARQKVTVAFGDDLWHRNERVESVDPVTVRNSGIDEQMYLITTSSENALGARKNGRILLAFHPEPGASPVAGLYFVTERDREKIVGAYADVDFRAGKAMRLLVDKARRLGIARASGPFSEAGRSFVRRHGLKVVR